MEEYIAAFLDSLQSERNLSKNTIESYRLDLEQFCNFVYENSENEVSSVQDVTYEDINKYCNSIAHLSTATVQRKLSSLKQFYKFLVLEERIKSDPTKNILRPKMRRTLPRVIAVDDIRNLCTAIDALPDHERIRTRLIFMLLYGCGLRVSELITLKQNSIEGNFIRIYGKGAKERITPIAPKIVACFREYAREMHNGQWLFPSSAAPIKHISRQRIFQIIKKVAVAADLPYESLSPHVLRHAFATHILNNGGDLLSVKNMLGHKSISTTEIYTHVTQTKLKEIVQQCHPLAKMKIK